MAAEKDNVEDHLAVQALQEAAFVEASVEEDAAVEICCYFYFSVGHNLCFCCHLYVHLCVPCYEMGVLEYGNHVSYPTMT